MSAKIATTLILAALLPLAACVSMPSPTAPTAQAPVSASTEAAAPVPTAGEWQLYTNNEVGFSIQYPPTWTQETLPDQNNGAIHGIAFTGPEGGVEVYWGVGFGGACPSGTEPVQLAQGVLPACHVTSADGTETWSQIGYEVDGGNSFSVRAFTNDALPSSHDLVLHVLSTLTFLPPAQPQAGAAIANPASQNCADKGGALSIEERGDGGQFGVCTFEDNMQCEEWALLRGDCPIGGVKVTGFATPAGRYCAITGGQYAVSGNSGADDEQGTCTFSDGSQCDAWDYYNGKCTLGATAAPTPPPAAAPAVTIQPLSMEVCDGQAQAMAHALDVLEVTQSEAPMSDPVTGASGTGCLATVTGTGEQFESPQAVVDTLGGMLEDQGWTADPMLVADGPTGTDRGYRKGDEICWTGAQWWPDDSANCPKDQPISVCPVTPAQQVYTVTLNCGVETQQEQITGAAGMANPASVNCTEQGGTLSIEERGDDGQFGVCTFDDDMQCEEWALLRGDCPLGGIKVTGYVTPAARYCAITGGQYAVTANSGAADEHGTCTFKDGSQCDVWEYYDGKCAPGGAPAPAATPTAGAGLSIRPLSTEECNGLAQAMAHALDVSEVTQSEAPLSDFVYGASGTGCQATVTGTGEQFESSMAVVNTLGGMLADQGWTADPMLAAGGWNAVELGYRKGDEICWAGAGWMPDESANCPEGQPFSTCPVTPEQQVYTVTLNCGVEVPQEQAAAAVTATQVITYVPGPPTGQPQQGNCRTNSLAVWREDAWRCMVGNGIYDPCFSSGESVICGANPVTTTVSFALTLTEPLPTPEVPSDTAGHAWLVELADGTVCEYATGATGGVGDQRINYFCPSPDANQSVVILGDLQPDGVWMAKRAVLTGGPPNPTVLESAEVPIRTIWR